MARLCRSLGVPRLEVTQPLRPRQRLHHRQRRPQVRRPVSAPEVLHQAGQPLLIFVRHSEPDSRCRHTTDCIWTASTDAIGCILVGPSLTGGVRQGPSARRAAPSKRYSGGRALTPGSGGLISIFAGCLSWAAGLGTTGLWALWVDGWVVMIWKRREGPLRTRGCGPAAHTPRNLDPREADGVPPANAYIACSGGLPAVVPSRELRLPASAASVCGGGRGDTGMQRTLPPIRAAGTHAGLGR
jgi:hypothetical protein